MAIQGDVRSRVADPGGLYPNPGPTFVRNPDPDPTKFLPCRIHLSRFSFDIKVNMFYIAVLYFNFGR